MQPLTREDVQSVMADPYSIYSLTPLGQALCLAVAEVGARGAGGLPPAHWARVKELFTEALRRLDLHMERAHRRLRMPTASQQAAFDAELAGVVVGGTILEFSAMATVLRVVLGDASIAIPCSGTTILAPEERQTVLVLAASAGECFPPAPAAAGRGAGSRR